MIALLQKMIAGFELTRSLPCLVLLITGIVFPARAQVTGVSYTLTPVVERVNFDKNAGLGDGTFAGAMLGFGFGEYAELTGLYLVSTDLQTDFSSYSSLGRDLRERFELLPSRDVRVRRYGANLKFNIGRSAVFPFVSAGTGILQFDPDILEDSRVIYLTGAAGLQFGLGERFALLVQIEDLVYRYNPASSLLSVDDLDALGLEAADFGQVNVNNLVVRAGLQMYVGGRARGELTDFDLAFREQFSHGLSGLRLQVEPLIGLIDLDRDLGFRDNQRIAGITAGFDFGPHLGLRGYYWRGVKDNAITDFDNLQAYGAEIRLRFSEIMGRVTPHVALGGGYLDVLDGYESKGAVEAVDRPFASGGGGVTLPLFSAVNLHAGAGLLAIGTEDAEDLSEPSQISANVFYTAGISFGLGGGGIERGPIAAASPRRSRRDDSLERELAQSQREADSLRRALNLAGQGIFPMADTTAVLQVGAGARFITIPLPSEGEFYVRYGEPSRSSPTSGADRLDRETGAIVSAPERATSANRPLTANDIEAIVRDVLQRELRSDRPEASSLSEAERRLLERIASLEERLADREADLEARFRRDVERPDAGYELGAVMPFIGVGLSGGQVGFVGFRADLRTQSLAGARFLPELVVAAGGDGLSYALNADMAIPLGFSFGSFRPYVGFGLGLVTVDGAELMFNLLGGVEQDALRGRFFAEYMSQDFFQLNRIALGYRLSL